MQTIEQIKQQNDQATVAFIALITTTTTKKTRTNKNYVVWSLQDKTGTITANVWDSDTKPVADFPANSVVVVTGSYSSQYANVTVKGFRAPNATEPHDPADFISVPQPPEPADRIKAELKEYVAAITNPTWHQIVTYLLDQQPNYFTQPAAKAFHHAFYAGLAFHSLSILRLTKQVCALHPEINRDLVYTGAILHDYGKTQELTDFPLTKYSRMGQLLGHISIADGAICTAVAKLNLDGTSEEVLLLRHLILSHHGKLEFGSPVLPLTAEAELLNRLDDMDASLTEFATNDAELTPGEFAQQGVFALNRRKIYRPSLTDAAHTKAAASAQPATQSTSTAKTASTQGVDDQAALENLFAQTPAPKPDSTSPNDDLGDFELPF